MNRRKAMKLAAATLSSVAIGGGIYTLMEAKWCRVLEVTLKIARLPKPFVGTTVAFLADVHHGPFVPRSYIQHVVAMTNALNPDLVLLGGDYVHRHPRYIAPSIAELGKLRGKLGRFAVLGNHDNWEDGPATQAALAASGITELTNTGVWLNRDGARLRLCGVGDLWTEQQNLMAALEPTSHSDAVILLSHNPDYVETLTDRRVSLVLSGHTHGGQVVVPGYGAPMVPSRYGQKYVRGLVQGPVCPVFITRGVGTVTPPVRFCCRPEVVLITLT